MEGAENASLKAKEWNGDLVFLHDVKPGAADKSYGIQVAKLAGLPPAAVSRAHEVLNKLEDDAKETGPSMQSLPLFSARPVPAAPQKPSEVEAALRSLDVDGLSARDALDLLYDLRAKLAAKDEIS